MSTKEYCVYMHKNKINDKVYIGLTKDTKKRWRNNGADYKPKKENTSRFYNAILKYGWDNFEHIIIEDNLTKEEASEKEKYYILKYNSLDRNTGYNIAEGGNGGNPYAGKTEEEMLETKKKMSKKRKGEKHPLYGKTHTEETRKKMSENHADVSGKNNPMYGKTHTEDVKKRLREFHIKKVICITTNKIFNSAIEASEYYSCCNSGIGKCCQGKQKTCGKHPITNEPLKWMYYDEYLQKEVGDSNVA